jgi:hypothetical protein
MRFVRIAACLAAAGSLIAVGDAHAATVRPACNLITDDAGDANDPTGFFTAFGGPNPAPNNAAVDILGGDLATDKTTVTAVLKLSKAPALDPTSPQGDYFYVEFRPASAANTVYLSANTDATGKLNYSAGSIVTDPATQSDNYTGSPDVPVRGRLDGASIVMTADLAAFKSLASIKAGMKINDLAGESFGIVDPSLNGTLPVPGLLLGGDKAMDSKPYIAGAKSCVVPVK